MPVFARRQPSRVARRDAIFARKKIHFPVSTRPIQNRRAAVTTGGENETVANRFGSTMTLFQISAFSSFHKQQPKPKTGAEKERQASAADGGQVRSDRPARSTGQNMVNSNGCRSNRDAVRTLAAGTFFGSFAVKCIALYSTLSCVYYTERPKSLFKHFFLQSGPKLIFYKYVSLG